MARLAARVLKDILLSSDEAGATATSLGEMGTLGSAALASREGQRGLVETVLCTAGVGGFASAS